MSFFTLIRFVTAPGLFRLIFLAGLLVIPAGYPADAHFSNNNTDRYQTEMSNDCGHELAEQDVSQVSQSGSLYETENCCANCDMPDCASPASASGHGLIIASTTPYLLLATDIVSVPVGTQPLTMLTDTPKRPPRI